MSSQRPVFLVSDHTGLTVESIGRTLISQFPGLEPIKFTLPFIDSIEKARQASAEIDRAASAHGLRPIVFSTLTDPDARAVIASSNALVLDLFDLFGGPLETELGRASAAIRGLSHGITSQAAYQERMDAVSFTLAHDDGLTSSRLNEADVILLGVSRCGKTPTCLYLAMQFGLRAANYPLTPEDLDASGLPKPLAPVREKLFGLSIKPERLSQIRNERMPGSNYASPENCRREIRLAEALFRSEHIRYLDTTTKSVEEIAITILHMAHLDKGRR